MEEPGKRERHKARTRRALQEAARRLFTERGYADTAVRDIAAAAGVTERTFFRYFPSKEDLVLGEVLDLIPVLREAIRSRPPAEPPYTAVLHALVDVAARRADQPDGAFAVLFSGPPGRFLARPTRPAQSVLLEFEDGVADVLAERLADGGDGGPDLALRASVLARASVAAMRAVIIAYSALPESGRDPAEAVRLARVAFEVLPNR